MRQARCVGRRAVDRVRELETWFDGLPIVTSSERVLDR
jgi:hypothetical protein